MKQYRYVALTALLSVLIFCLLYMVNLRSARLDASLLDGTVTESPNPVILTGGQYQTDREGRTEYTIAFHWEGIAYLYSPRSSEIIINGAIPEQIDAYRGNIYVLQSTPVNQGNFTVTLPAGNGIPAPLSACLYFGTYGQISHFLDTSIQCNYFISGLCIAVTLFSAILYFWKRSEHYLFWLACMAVTVSSYYGPLLLLNRLFPFPPFSLLRNANLYLLFNQLAIAIFQYHIMADLMPVRILGKPFYLYFLLAAVAPALCYQNTALFSCAMLFFFLVLYTCYGICFSRIGKDRTLEKYILFFAWDLTTVARLFEWLCEIGITPCGDINLRFRLRGILSCFYVVAFFLIACKRFAQKYQEADTLNTHLEEEIVVKSRQQTVFIRSMLHNLKTPLFSLSGYSDMAYQTIDSDPDKARQYIRHIQEKALYVGHIMDQVFFITQMESGLIRFQSVPLNLADLLRSCEDTSAPQAAEKKIGLRLEIPDIMPAVGDPLYLQQAFQNILDNALVHTPPAGTIAVSASTEGDFWRLDFTDDGCGIPPEDQEKIFEAYYSHRPGQAKSSGLGLSITREILSRHGGQIRAENKPDQGADFIVLLPVSRNAEKITRP